MNNLFIQNKSKENTWTEKDLTDAIQVGAMYWAPCVFFVM